MRIKKLHLARILLSSLFTIMFLKVTAVMITLSKYVLTRLLLDIAEYNVIVETGFDSSVTWFINIWFYIIFFVVVFLVWRFFGLPNELGIIKKINDMGRFFDGFIPGGNPEDEEDEEIE